MLPADLTRSTHHEAVSLYQPIFYISSFEDHTNGHHNGSMVPPALPQRNFLALFSSVVARALPKEIFTICKSPRKTYFVVIGLG